MGDPVRPGRAAVLGPGSEAAAWADELSPDGPFTLASILPPLSCGSPLPPQESSLPLGQPGLASPEPWVQIPVASAALSLPSVHGWPTDVPKGPWLRGGAV